MPSLEEILTNINSENIKVLVSDISKNPNLFSQLVLLMGKDEHPISMRASWVAYHAYHITPQLVKPYLKQFLALLATTKIDSTKRSLLKILNNHTKELTEEEFGILADLAFTWAEDPKQAIAVKAFSIDILVNVIKTYPEAINEVIAIIESILPDASSGLKNKCKKTLKKLKSDQSK